MNRVFTPERSKKIPIFCLSKYSWVVVMVAIVAASLLPFWLAGFLALSIGFLILNTMAATRINSEMLLREYDEKFETFVDQSLVGIYLVQNGQLVYANVRLAHLLGYATPMEMIGISLSNIVLTENGNRLLEDSRLDLIDGHQCFDEIHVAIKSNGQKIWVEMHNSTCEHQGKPSVMGVLLDVSDRVKFEQRSRLANRVFEEACEGILTTDAECRIEAVNPAFTRITGYEAAQAVGKMSHIMFGVGSERSDIIRERILTLAQKDHWEGEILDRRKNGDWYPAWLSISTVRDVNKKLTNYVAVFTDNTKRKEAESHLQFIATHDGLTGILNRSGMFARFSEELVSARNAERQLGLLFIDLDRFKAVNDTLGHLIGDQLLMSASSRMQAQLKETDLLARLGGDEFTVVIKDIDSPEMVSQVVDRLISSMAQPFVIDGREIFVTVSIGVACYPNDGNDVYSLLKSADTALYRAKERGKNTFQFFSKDMDSHGVDQLELETSLRYALMRNEFVLYYQPQVCTATGKLLGVEALIRWQHPVLGMVPPSDFIGLAEKNGLIVPIGAWVLHEACRQCKAWLTQGFTLSHVAVNLSARQFSSDYLLETIRAALDENDLPATMLELEITESTIMYNPEEAITLLNRLRQMGVLLSIDDFGTGYSSLSSLKQYPLDRLKIDRSFVSGIPHDVDDVAITEAIIAVAHKMHLEVVAEGVETREQLAFLRAADCDLVQGFLIGRPITAEELEQRFISEKCWVPAESAL